MGEAQSKTASYGPPVVMGGEYIMNKKAHGTSHTPVQDNLRWGCDKKLANKICNYNRHYAENSGYFIKTKFIKEEMGKASEKTPINFHDSNTGKLLFVAPKGRSFEEFVKESRSHGWPSFRDEEVDWTYVRVLRGGEVVSVDGTHLGHNLPDGKGNRYCINLVCVAGRPVAEPVVTE
mmetsp:Transcript_19966/g.29748  ORF Transcript_19966/g.29748 Transcript_19966/m.29748 type:complete len:177 (-) Transcript_19966:222-752(-)|eukprot:CAMPEP_0116029604 /NCGR_PEP_ID=MMETSP0321-20121206/16238_1 /TAXON_ID=163516 /ORGANISM="Leptocylindrus danicus var. danicus, Strain B650" /LENGTH=176 /DNA_ID=CAMNT_0003504011 /DNA_START=67 /DNA_END=597 /DNA_ORIENTATION=-